MSRLDFSVSDLDLPATRDDYVLTPAYDLLNTSVHFPGEPAATG